MIELMLAYWWIAPVIVLSIVAIYYGGVLVFEIIFRILILIITRGESDGDFDSGDSGGGGSDGDF